MFLIRNLVEKDFKVRYRNMSLGVLWSLLNPLIMMGLLTFIFTKIFAQAPRQELSAVRVVRPGSTELFHAGLGHRDASSILDNATLIKRVPVPRQVFPIASVLSNCLHLLIQIALLLAASSWCSDAA